MISVVFPWPLCGRQGQLSSSTYLFPQWTPCTVLRAAPLQPWDQGELVTVPGAQRGRQEGKQRVSKTLSCLLPSHHVVLRELGVLGPDRLGGQRVSQS